MNIIKKTIFSTSNFSASINAVIVILFYYLFQGLDFVFLKSQNDKLV